MISRTDGYPRMLLVDDEPDILSYLKTMIARTYPDASVILAQNATDALDVLRSTPIDLIVSDYHMPGIDGVTMLTTARALAPQAIRVLLTGHADIQTAQRAVNEGQIHAFFQKPTDTGILLATLDRLLAERAPTNAGRSHAARPHGPPSVRDDAAPTATPRVLVVDDILELAELFRSFSARLAPGTVEIVVERDAREALRRIERETFAAIITDYDMPHVKGTRLLGAARRIQPGARRVLVTGYNEIPETSASLGEAAIDAYLEKPLGRKETLDLTLAVVSLDPHAMDVYRAQARIAERLAKQA